MGIVSVVESEHELVQVRLEILGADSMINEARGSSLHFWSSLC